MYDNWKTYGPYRAKDGRFRIIVVNPETNKKTTISYPKYLVEQNLNRKLDKDEVIHHIDGDIENNNISNFRIMKRSIHSSFDKEKCVDSIVFCRMCGKKIIIKNSYHTYLNRHNSGYFCSKQCIGKYGSMIQNNQISSIFVERIKPIKYNASKECQNTKVSE